ncbi:MAG: hypothetical protein M1827_003109, partial [Pycnora praestabilis]
MSPKSFVLRFSFLFCISTLAHSVQITFSPTWDASTHDLNQYCSSILANVCCVSLLALHGEPGTGSFTYFPRTQSIRFTDIPTTLDLATVWQQRNARGACEGEVLFAQPGPGDWTKQGPIWSRPITGAKWGPIVAGGGSSNGAVRNVWPDIIRFQGLAYTQDGWMSLTYRNVAAGRVITGVPWSDL